MTIDRRKFVFGTMAVATLGSASIAESQGANSPQAAVPFSFDWLLGEASRIASTDFKPQSDQLPASIRNLTYDQFRDIRFKPDAAIWADQATQFRLDFFHLGFVYTEPVRIALVENGKATDVPFSTDYFTYGPLVQPPKDASDLGFSGFRARFPINTPDVYDEFVVFQGASYFRAVARNQVYGLSARGLAINTAEPEGEEFPVFRKFWIEKPSAEADTLVVYALLDSPSAGRRLPFRHYARRGDGDAGRGRSLLPQGRQEGRRRAADLDVPVRRHEPQRLRRLPARRARFRRAADALRPWRVDLAAA